MTYWVGNLTSGLQQRIDYFVLKVELENIVNALELGDGIVWGSFLADVRYQQLCHRPQSTFREER